MHWVWVSTHRSRLFDAFDMTMDRAYNVRIQCAQPSCIFGVTGIQNHLDYGKDEHIYCMLLLKAIWPSGLPSWKKSIFGGMGKKETPSTSKHTNMNDAFYPPQKTLSPALMNPSHVLPLVLRLECKYFKIPAGSRFFYPPCVVKNWEDTARRSGKYAFGGPMFLMFVNSIVKKMVLWKRKYY